MFVNILSELLMVRTLLSSRLAWRLPVLLWLPCNIGLKTYTDFHLAICRKVAESSAKIWKLVLTISTVLETGSKFIQFEFSFLIDLIKKMLPIFSEMVHKMLSISLQWGIYAWYWGKKNSISCQTVHNCILYIAKHCSWNIFRCVLLVGMSVEQWDKFFSSSFIYVWNLSFVLVLSVPAKRGRNSFNC